jgi:hypothetical protein
MAGFAEQAAVLTAEGRSLRHKDHPPQRIDGEKRGQTMAEKLGFDKPTKG